MHKTHKKLTPKQSRFAAAYVKNGGNGSKAAREAGYSMTDGVAGQQASENLKKRHIINQIQVNTVKALKAKDLTPEHVIEGLMRESGLDGAGGPLDGQHGGRVRAMELCGKALPGGLFTERVVSEDKAMSPTELIVKLASDGCPAMALAVIEDLNVPISNAEDALRSSGHTDLADKLTAIDVESLEIIGEES